MSGRAACRLRREDLLDAVAPRKDAFLADPAVSENHRTVNADHTGTGSLARRGSRDRQCPRSGRSHRASALRRAARGVGERIRIRIVTYFGHYENLSPYPAPDIVLSWDAPQSAPEDRVTVMREAAQPVCLPWYAEANRETLAGPVTGWGELTFLFTFERTEHCADWDDWFEIAGRPGPEPVIEHYEYDANVLEAAAVGRGIALGWRGYVERLIAARTLVTPTDGCVEFGNTTRQC